MASITVDVSLDDFDLDELLEEVGDRYNYDKEQIEEWAKDLFEIERFDVRLSLLDQMKIDLLMQNINKITLNDLEKLI
jgi:ABC-type microcin C transport system permease subunit YejB